MSGAGARRCIRLSKERRLPAASPPACPPPTPLSAVCTCRWLPGTAKLLALGCYARGTGTLQLYELDGASLELAAEAEQPASLKCACVLSGGSGAGSTKQQLIALGNFDGQLQLMDADRLGSSSEPLWRVQAHAGVVNGLDACDGQVGAAVCTSLALARTYVSAASCSATCAVHERITSLLRYLQGAPLIATAGKDGGVRVWDPRAPDAPAAAFLPAAGGAAPDAWCVAIGNAHNTEERCVLAGYANGDIKMFDLCGGGAAVRWETNVGKGVCGVQVGCLSAAAAAADVLWGARETLLRTVVCCCTVHPLQTLSLLKQPSFPAHTGRSRSLTDGTSR